MKIALNLSDLYKMGILKSRLFDPSVIKIFNRYLLGVASVLFVYLVVEMIWIRPYKDIAVSQTGAAARSKAGRPSAADETPYSAYSGSIVGKKIFTAAPGQAGGPGSISTSDDMSGDLGLVGIITGEEPQVIIENKKTLKTYYLNKGQSFDGYVVEEISEGKVVLEYSGKRISLFL